MLEIIKKGNRKAIISIIIGQSFMDYWQRYCRLGWQEYAAKYNYDILIYTEPLDQTERAAQRSPSWQKCLIIDEKIEQNYERIVWIDSDVVINAANAPCIVEGVPIEKIGGTDAYSFFSHELHDYLYGRYIELAKGWNKKLIVNPTGADYYRNFGIQTDLNQVIQAGVLVLQPRLHRSVLEYTYGHYEEKYSAEHQYYYNYEMRPLSYEIVSRDLHYFIEARFNFILTNYLYFAAPYLFHMDREDSAKGQRKTLASIEQLTVTAAYSHSYFLHFAGEERWKALAACLLQDVQNPEDFKGLGLNSKQAHFLI